MAEEQVDKNKRERELAVKKIELAYLYAYLTNSSKRNKEYDGGVVHFWEK